MYYCSNNNSKNNIKNYIILYGMVSIIDGILKYKLN